MTPNTIKKINLLSKTTLFVLFFVLIFVPRIFSQTDRIKYEKTLYVLSIGVNVNKDQINPVQALKYAENDAVKFSKFMDKRKSGSYPNVHSITLVGKKATSSNIRAILECMAGKEPGCGNFPDISEELKYLSLKMYRNNQSKKLRPEDGLLIYFSGHGFRSCKKDNRNVDKNAEKRCANENFGNALDLIVYDTVIEKDGSELRFTDSWKDTDFDDKLAEIQSGRMAIILDSCYSGASEATGDDWRLGPLNSSGFSQLIYEKGIFILASSQKDQQSRERKREEHGIFTASLMKSLGDSPLNLQTWFERSKDYFLENKPSNGAGNNGVPAWKNGICREKSDTSDSSSDIRPMNPPENIRTSDMKRPEAIDALLKDPKYGISNIYLQYLNENKTDENLKIKLARFFADKIFNEEMNLCQKDWFDDKIREKEADLRKCGTSLCQARIILDAYLGLDNIESYQSLDLIQEPKFLYYKRPQISPEDWEF